VSGIQPAAHEHDIDLNDVRSTIECAFRRAQAVAGVVRHAEHLWIALQ
jgi:hypothetical protein